MKKILAPLTLAASALVPASIATAPSAGAATCSDMRTKVAGIDWAPASRSNVWRVTGAVRFQYCTGNPSGPYSRVYSYQVSFDPNGSVCASGHDAWRANPNIIGGWNPGEKGTSCESQQYSVLSWDAPGTYVLVDGSDPGSERCIGASLEAGIVGYPDAHETLPSLCVI